MGILPTPNTSLSSLSVGSNKHIPMSAMWNSKYEQERHFLDVTSQAVNNQPCNGNCMKINGIRHHLGCCDRVYDVTSLVYR